MYLAKTVRSEISIIICVSSKLAKLILITELEDKGILSYPRMLSFMRQYRSAAPELDNQIINPSSEWSSHPSLICFVSYLLGWEDCFILLLDIRGAKSAPLPGLRFAQLSFVLCIKCYFVVKRVILRTHTHAHKYLNRQYIQIVAFL